MAQRKPLVIGSNNEMEEIPSGDTLGLAHGGAGADLSTTGPGVLVQETAGAAVSVEAALAPSRGGTGEASLAAALAALLAEVGGTPGPGKVIVDVDGEGNYEWRSGAEPMLVGDFEETFRLSPREKYLACDGAALKQSEYEDLYAAIGDQYARESTFDRTSMGTLAGGGDGKIASDGNGKWLKVNGDSTSTYWVSTDDGVTWTSQTGPATNLSAVGYGGGVWIIGAGSNLYSSSTGLTSSWTSRHTGVVGHATHHIRHNGTRFHAWSDANNGSGMSYATSTDGISWSGGSLTVSNGYARGLVWFAGLWVVTSDLAGNASIWTSTDTSPALTARKTGISSSAAGGSLAASADICVAVHNNKVHSSPDAITWTERTLPTSPYTGFGGYSRVTWDSRARRFLLTSLTSSTTAGYWTSPNGVDWVYGGSLRPTTTSADAPVALFQVGGTIVGCNNNNGYGLRYRHPYDRDTEFLLPTTPPDALYNLHIKATP
jgi:hypothetical protein